MSPPSVPTPTSPPVERPEADVSIPAPPTALAPPEAKPPLILSPEQDPIHFLASMLDPLIAATAMFSEEFGWAEAYRELIDIFRNAPKPSDRMAALDRLMRLAQNALIAKGAIAKVSDSIQIRSPDGTTAERSVITRQLVRSFEKDNERAAALNRQASAPLQALPAPRADPPVIDMDNPSP